MKRFRDLKVWQESVELAESIYTLTRTFPSEEKFGLVSQMRRAIVSISSNIAEGSGRNNPKEFRQFLGIAIGSAFELESQIEICFKLEFIDKNNRTQLQEKLRFVQNMLFKLRDSIKIT